MNMVVIFIHIFRSQSFFFLGKDFCFLFFSFLKYLEVLGSFISNLVIGIIKI